MTGRRIKMYLRDYEVAEKEGNTKKMHQIAMEIKLLNPSEYMLKSHPRIKEII